MPTLYMVGIVSTLLSRQNKRLGDYVAGTVVVHEKPLAEVAPVWEAPSRPAEASRAHYGARRLGDDQLRLIEAFLQRRHDLAADVRARMAGQIADRAAAQLGIARNERPPSEEFLESLMSERRSGG